MEAAEECWESEQQNLAGWTGRSGCYPEMVGPRQRLELHINTHTQKDKYCISSSSSVSEENGGNTRKITLISTRSLPLDKLKEHQMHTATHYMIQI